MKKAAQAVSGLSLALVMVGTAVAWTPAFQSSGDSTVEKEIRKTLAAQEKAWNAGNIVGFMDGYVRDESLRFSSGDTTRRGWQEALLRYQANYPTREKMGTLTFSDLEITELSPDFAEVFGKFHLARDKAIGDASGLFTLLMKREEDHWLVWHDHTSSGD